MNAPFTPMERVAGRALSDLQAEVCEVDREDLWKLHSETFCADARQMLNACGAPELLEALQECKQLLDMVLCVQGGLPPEANGPAAKAVAAIRKATGAAQ